jgi:VWFA-related protein
VGPLLFALILGPQQQPTFTEKVEVERVLVDVRVLDDSGGAVLGLGPSSFTAEIDDHPTEVESVSWAGAEPYAEGLSPDEAASLGLPPSAPGQLIVLFVQRDASEASRVTGLMEARVALRTFLESLPASALVAVVRFEHHLDLVQDFTLDRARIRALVDEMPVVRGGGDRIGTSLLGPSLATGLDVRKCRNAGTPEEGMGLVGTALEPLPGAKSMIVMGWGLGEWSPIAGATMRAGYPDALATLARARVTVFALDVTQANSHSLEFGLRTVAADTGGIYAKTFENPDLAFRQVAGAISGHYVLSLVKPSLAKGLHHIKVRLVGSSGRVLMRGSYQG